MCELLENVLEIKLGPNSPGLMSSFLGECWGLTQTQAAWLVWKEGTLLSRPNPSALVEEMSGHLALHLFC